MTGRETFMVSTREYRVGLVGCGGRGRGLGRYVAGVENMRLVAVADLAAERLEQARAELGDVACYTHHTEMLADAELDIAIIGTTGQFHAAITRDIAASKVRGIYCEKPMACSLADADQMIADCAASGTVLQIGHQRRWMPQVVQVRDALRAGAIGRVTHGSMYWPTGRLGSNGTHFFDALNFLLDSTPVEVSGRVVYGLDTTRVDPHEVYAARLAGDPGAFGFITYANGVRIALDCVSDVLLPYTYTFCGSKGWLKLCEIGWEVDYRARDEDTRSLTKGWIAAPLREFPALPADVLGQPEQGGYRELMHCIETGAQPTSTGADGRSALETIVAFHVSSDAGMRAVSLPLPPEENERQLIIH
jgi:predicted dehydrogenase